MWLVTLCMLELAVTCGWGQDLHKLIVHCTVHLPSFLVADAGGGFMCQEDAMWCEKVA